MAYGYHGRILHVNLTEGTTEVEQPNEVFYRTYMGGSAMGAYYLLKHTPPHADPLGPDNTLSIMVGVLTGAPISGNSRVSVTAKSPISEMADASEAGGFFPAELKFTGFDGIVIHGTSRTPVYLWIHDGEVDLRDASALMGKFTADVEDAIRAELNDKRIQVMQCGPAAERGVRFSALVNNANRVNGRGGMGLVMASKNLKAIAVRGRNRPELANPDTVAALARWGAQNVDDSGVAGFKRLGTANMLTSQDAVGGLPTNNWSSGTLENAEAIGGERMLETILKTTDSCYACAVRCKRVVEVTEGPFQANPRYGGPEYESISALGSYCGIANLEAIAHANQLCNMYGMDTIACGGTIAWAMDCFEHGLITAEDTGGINLRFGNAEALVQMVEMIGERKGFGKLLGEGSQRAAEALGLGQDLVVATKGREFPAHMPQVKRAFALLYAVNPGGADHTVCEHETSYARYPEGMAALGLMDPQPTDILNPEKVRYALYSQRIISALDSVCGCKFVWGPAWQLFSTEQWVDALKAITGWSISLWELMKVGERRINLLRTFNAREGATAAMDTLPKKMTVPLKGGATDGVFVTEKEFEEAKALYYAMAGWDEEGRPRQSKLDELGIKV
jgi:aldehyde:ferredoxin oxidoreductase